MGSFVTFDRGKTVRVLSGKRGVGWAIRQMLLAMIFCDKRRTLSCKT